MNPNKQKVGLIAAMRPFLPRRIQPDEPPGDEDAVYRELHRKHLRASTIIL
jgi:hypothetical protein